jgi:hypothetical protein
MANRQIPAGPQSPVVNGTIDRVPCPHCGHRNDFRLLREQQLLDTGHRMDCDACHRVMEVTSIRDVTVVAVRKWAGGPQQGQQQQQPQRRQLPQQQQAPGLMQRLLGKGPKR